MECPVGAINYVKAKYEIDPEKCNECGHCAEVCHISAITDTSAPVIGPTAHDLRKLSCDLLVLGGGGSGLVAAVKVAHLSGKKVIVLEKAKKPGGNANLAHGFMAFYSKWQRDAGDPDTRDELIRKQVQAFLGRLSPRIISAAVYASGEFFDWLCELGGTEECFELTEIYPWAGDTRNINYRERKFANLECRDPAIGPGWAGTYVVRKMLEYCEKLGIPVLTEHRAREILTDTSRRVVGVLADDPGGQTQIDCKACVLATGGFGRSDEKLKKYFPQFFDDGEYIHRFSVPTNTGDAIDMGEKIGADVPYEHLCAHIMGPLHHPFGYCIFHIMQQPEAAYINLNGKRWIDESTGTMRSRYLISQQPKGITYSVMDDNLVDVLGQRLIANPPDGNDGWILKDYRMEIEEELALDTPAKGADTLEGLAEQMGVDARTFVAEIEKYNRYCANGRDEDFFKDPKALVPIVKPPFYAFYGKRMSEGAFGGVQINENTEVLDKQGKVIPGLYATGDAASAGANHLGQQFQQTDVPLSVISDLTWAFASGYIAGCQVGEVLKG
jgi:succinate dehydrogenase/fumarate reductase flavoprotein subunit